MVFDRYFGYFSVPSDKRQKVDRMNHSGVIALVDTASFKIYEIRWLLRLQIRQ
tara:strand:+ start:9836 stop:9994 length:159 start_codon:yes stop_codon:yes gene_type:complete